MTSIIYPNSTEQEFSAMKLSAKQSAALGHFAHALAALVAVIVLGAVYAVLQGPDAAQLVSNPTLLGAGVVILGAALRFATAQEQANPVDPAAVDVVSSLAAPDPVTPPSVPAQAPSAPSVANAPNTAPNPPPPAAT